MPPCARCGDDHGPEVACAPRPAGAADAGPRSTTRRVPAVREITRPLPVLPPGSGAVVAGRYRLGSLVREDPPGVYLFGATDRMRDDEPVAVRLYGAPASTETGAEFIRALSSVRALAAPGVAPILEVGLDRAGGLYVVEDLGAGPDLATQIQRDNLPVLDTVGLARALAATLGGLHRTGLAHGALRPEVVVLGTGGVVERSLLADVAGRAAQRATGRHAPAGCYDAPERDPARPPLPAEDLYALGALLFRLLAGRPPDGEAARRPLSEVCPDVPVPKALEEAVRRTLAPDPAGRPRDAEELRAALDRAHADLAGPAGGEARSTELGRYTLVKLLARGGMGEVFLARVDGGSAPRLPLAGAAAAAAPPPICVVKRIRGEYAADDHVVGRFVAEARLAARMEHENVVSVYDLGRTGDDFFIVMEYVAGKDLRELLQRGRERGTAVPVEVSLHVAHELCRGLAYVHGFVQPGLAPDGLVHRDVSPQNILLAYDGRVKLIDFGLARGGLGAPQTSVGIVVGKLCYLSPEQARGQVATPQSDVYAAGLVLWELLCGRPFFDGEADQVARAVIDPRPEPPSRWRPDVPPAVDRICMRALAPDRAERYPSADAMAADLERALGGVARPERMRRAGGLLADAFAAERRGEDVMVRSARTPSAAASATPPPVEARGRSLLSDSEAMVVADTALTVRRFDWNALADSLSGEQPLPEMTTQRHVPPGRPGRRALLLLVVAVGLLAAVIVFFAVLGATRG